MARLAYSLVVGAIVVLVIDVRSGEGQATQEPPSTVTSCSQNDSLVFAHPTNCHQFYNCSVHQPLKLSLYFGQEGSFDQQYLHECQYPQLFSSLTLQCEDYRNVTCGDKFEPVDGCEYTRYQCRRAHCRPCHVDLPSCRGRPDGPNVYQYREWTPYFAVCRDQRTVNTSVCPTDDRLRVAQLFSPEFKKCVSLYEVPEEHQGYYLNCTGRADGLYPDDITHRPDLYFRCMSGALAEISLCPTGRIFDKQRSDCMVV